LDVVTLRYEDRELQIRLAELQADVQINLTICFGFFAGFLAIIMGFEQIYFSLPEENIFMKNLVSLLIYVSAFALLYVTFHFIRKAQDARKQIGELRKRYVW